MVDSSFGIIKKHPGKINFNISRYRKRINTSTVFFLFFTLMPENFLYKEFVY